MTTYGRARVSDERAMSLARGVIAGVALAILILWLPVGIVVSRLWGFE